MKDDREIYKYWQLQTVKERKVQASDEDEVRAGVTLAVCLRESATNH